METIFVGARSPRPSSRSFVFRSSFESRLSRSEDSDLSEPALGLFRFARMLDKSASESRLPALGLSESRFIGDLSGRSAMCIAKVKHRR